MLTFMEFTKKSVLFWYLETCKNHLHNNFKNQVKQALFSGKSLNAVIYALTLQQTAEERQKECLMRVYQSKRCGVLD